MTIPRKVLVSLALALLSCATGQVYRPCPHGGGVYLSAHSEEPMDPPSMPMPIGSGFVRSAAYPPVIVRVTVHNTHDYPIEASLACGVNDLLTQKHTVQLGPLQETDLVFPVQRRSDGLSVKFSCEIENWVSR